MEPVDAAAASAQAGAWDLDLSLFDEVGDARRGMAPPELGELQLPRASLRDKGLVRNRGAAARALRSAGCGRQRSQAGEGARARGGLSQRVPEVGGFLGRADVWRRVSETWPDPDLSERELGEELAARLLDYVTAIAPVRRTRHE